jgi:hypothetical protein
MNYPKFLLLLTLSLFTINLHTSRITGDAVFPIAIQRMKEVDIANGGVYGDGIMRPYFFA